MPVQGVVPSGREPPDGFVGHEPLWGRTDMSRPCGGSSAGSTVRYGAWLAQSAGQRPRQVGSSPPARR